MTKFVYPATSAYSATPQSDWAIGRYVHRRIAPHSDDAELTVEAKYEHRPDLLASDLYGRSALFWVFTSRNLNLMRDPIWDLKTGMTIMVPSAEFLRETLGL